MTLTSEELLRRIGKYAADLVEDGMFVGLGTGTTATAMVDALGERVRDGLKITGVATSVATANHASKLGIPLKNLDGIDRLDLCIDGADEIDPDFNLTKGHGGALLFEKLVARAADHFVVISSDEKLVDALGTRMPLPVEVVSVGWAQTAEEVLTLGFTPTLRRESSRPFLTDGGHYILDCDWPDSGLNPAALASDLKSITGVVDHGLFIGLADTVITISADGKIVRRDKES